MPYFTDLNIYLHQSSLLIQAYPSTRITTKYSLPRKPNVKANSQPKHAAKDSESAAETTDTTTTQTQPKRERSATLTLKTFHPESGICLKYRTDKAAEVGRLLNGLGRLAKGDVIDMPSAVTATASGDADKMDIDGGAASAVVKTEDKVATAPPVATQGTGAGGGGGKGKKKKGKK